MSGFIIAGLAALYVLLFLFFIIGLLKTHRYKGEKATPSVTVVVPMRNEEEFAERTLEALAVQDYAGLLDILQNLAGTCPGGLVTAVELVVFTLQVQNFFVEIFDKVHNANSEKRCFLENK